MDDLDELLWNAGGDGSSISKSDWRRILDHVFAKLSTFFGVPLKMRGEPSIGKGFGIAFESVNTTENPLELRLWGTCGVDFPGGEYPCVQGFVYVYSGDLRLVALNGENHIYIRYARVDAANDDWDMADCTGPSEWRSYGWSVDEYGEFGGFERWPDAQQ